MDIKVLLQQNIATVELAMDNYLNNNNITDGTLLSAMQYSSLSGGKRIRSFILLNAYHDFGGNNNDIALKIAAALEFFHTYSLVHDDLPCIDNDDFRRGIPSCHKKFTEATAVLVGDALQTLAFEILSDANLDISADKKCSLINSLARCGGKDGMAKGQDFDIAFSLGTHSPAIEQITQMHILKTGLLFGFAMQAAAILTDKSTDFIANAYNCGLKIGQLFQLIDDLDDLQTEKDSSNNLAAIIGREKSLTQLQTLHHQIEQYFIIQNIKSPHINNLIKYLHSNITVI